jgi:hypothetical protein
LRQRYVPPTNMARTNKARPVRQICKHAIQPSDFYDNISQEPLNQWI